MEVLIISKRNFGGVCEFPKQFREALELLKIEDINIRKPKKKQIIQKKKDSQKSELRDLSLDSILSKKK